MAALKWRRQEPLALGRGTRFEVPGLKFNIIGSIIARCLGVEI